MSATAENQLTAATLETPAPQRAFFIVLAAISFCHLLNDMVQSLIVAMSGFVLAAAMASVTALVINALFVTGLPGQEQLCRLTAMHFVVLLGTSLLAAIVGGSLAAWRSSTMEIADVLHQA